MLKRINIVYDLSKPEGDKARSADYSRAKSILGWEPKTDLKEGIKQQYRWIENQLEQQRQ